MEYWGPIKKASHLEPIYLKHLRRGSFSSLLGNAKMYSKCGIHMVSTIVGMTCSIVECINVDLQIELAKDIQHLYYLVSRTLIAKGLN
jgi:hypothetical protein